MNKQTTPQGQFFRLRQLILPQLPWWGVAFGLGVLTVISVLGLVMVAGWFVSMAGVAGVLAGAGFSYALASFWIRIFALVRTFARYGDLMVSHHAVFALLKDLRVRTFARLASTPINQRHQKQTHSGEIMHRLVKDIDVLNEFVLRLVLPCVVSLVAVVGFGFCMVALLPSWTAWVVMLVLLVVVLAGVSLMAKSKGLATTESKLGKQRKTLLLNTLPALVQLILWDNLQTQIHQFKHLDDKHHALLQQTHANKRRHALVVQMLMTCAVALLLVGVQWYFLQNPPTPFNANNINDNFGLNPATALALTLGLFGLVEILLAVGGEPLALGRSLVAKNRLNALVSDVAVPNLKPFVWDKSPLVLQFDKLTVKMPHAISATQPMTVSLYSHSPVLITGVSGAGKSTLLNTLAGELAANSGQVLLNDIPLATLDLTGQLGYLGQWVDIFDQSLADNLRLGKPSASDDELLFVLEQVDLLKWVKAQPKGLNTPLGEYGMAVSGGQARRIALARLLLADKAILLLDEPFAGLDKHTCQKVWRSLTQKQKQGEIGLLIISTHQITKEMKSSQVIYVE